MRLKIDFHNDDSMNNIISLGDLAHKPYYVDMKPLVDSKSFDSRILDTLIVPSTSDQDKYQIIHLTNKGSLIIHHINKHQGDVSTKIYTSIIETEDLFEQEMKYLYYNELLNCLLVKLKNNITLLSLINFKKINKIIEKNLDRNINLNIIQNQTYVVLTYQIGNIIKFFIWDSNTTRYLKLKILNLDDYKKSKKQLKLISVEFLDDVKTDVFLLFENDVLVYNFDISTILNKNSPLKIIQNNANIKHSEIIKMIDKYVSTVSSDAHSIKSTKRKTVYVNFVGTLKDDLRGNLKVVDNRGNVYVYSQQNFSFLILHDKIILESDKALIDYFEADFRNKKTIFVYTNDGKNVDVCFNNYSVLNLDTSVVDVKNDRSIHILNDFVIHIDYKEFFISGVEIDYNVILQKCSFDHKPMNIINLINKIYEEDSNGIITDYLDLIRSVYSKLLILKIDLAKSNDMVLQFFNNKAIKYMLPLDVVMEVNENKESQKEFISYLLEVKRLLINIEKGDSEKYNFFFNDKVIIDNYNFFIYNETIAENGINYLFLNIDKKLLDYYLKRDINLVDMFLNNENTKCRLKSDYILSKLLELLKENNNQDIVSILKVIMTYCIKNESYRQGFEIILSLDQFMSHIDIPKDYLFKVAISYLIEMFGYLFSKNTTVVDNSKIDIFIQMVSETMSMNAEIVNNSLYLKSIFLQTNEGIYFDGLKEGVFTHFCKTIQSFKPKTFYRDFLEFYAFSGNNNVILNTLINYYIETDDFFTFPSILIKLYDLLNNNVKKWMPFEVMSLLNDKESTFNSGWENERWFKKYMQIKCLIWKEMQEDSKILSYYYQDKENGLSVCIKYIKSLNEHDNRHAQAVEYLGSLITNDYQEWMIYIDEFFEEIDIKNIPEFIKISDLNSIMLRSLMNKYERTSTIKKVLNANSDVANKQMEYLHNKKLNEYTEIQ
ncbi:uncharacterized protein HGUI_00737 [Hanseniaspora guilliermondii]|uniref:Uncharacterized protein n=1 Tax=Hanseniaspora guilliermondii TaxID=56406 RepID=A0A1L0CJL1_9ASCO|nr:uncharacterized protein HGUI_00737 [Hanseniaspora guilliermondii]